MREKPKYIPKIDEKASIIVTDGECYLDSESNIVGIEISFYGNAEITPQLPDGWIMQGNNRKMLIFRMSGSPIQKRLLFTYTGSVNITKSMIINDKAEKVSEKNKQDKSKWNEDNFQFDSDTTKWIARKNYNSNGKVKRQSITCLIITFLKWKI